MHPVAIVGGGPVGLSSSIFLSLCNVPHVLFERYPGTSIHPKALALNQRSMKFLRLLGIEEEIAQQRAAADTYSRTAWYTSLGPAGREIFARDSGGGGAYAGGYAEASPSQFTIFPQIRLEPILHRRAVELNPSGIFNSATATRIEEGTDSVQITVEHKLTGAIEEVEAAYLLGCDGGRTVAEAAGIAMEGERDIVDMVSAHIQSPISQHQPDPRVFLHWFINPELGGSIGTDYLYHCGPYPMNPETEEWIFACALNPGDPKKFEADDMLRRVRNTLQIPDLDIKLKSLSHWFVNSIVAERFRSAAGRVFLLGDAAHRVTPWGALGLNTGLQDAQNLLWKLVAAIKGDFKLDWNALLNSYNEERRPIALRVARTSLANLQAHSAVMDRALGILPENSPAVNVASLKAYLDPDDPNHEERKRAVEKAQEILDTEFHAPGAEIG